MSKYKIEKGVPIPPRSRYPLSSMEVGDSFLIPTTDGDKRASIRSMATYLKINVRSMKEESGIRIWRVK